MDYAFVFAERHVVCTKKSFVQHHSTVVVARRAMDELCASPRTPSNSEFIWTVNSLALSGKSVDVPKVIAMIEKKMRC